VIKVYQNYQNELSKKEATIFKSKVSLQLESKKHNFFRTKDCKFRTNFKSFKKIAASIIGDIVSLSERHLDQSCWKKNMK